MAAIFEMAEIVEIILRFLPGRYVGIAAQVCHLWYETVQRIRISRIKFPVYLSAENAKFSDFCSDVLDFVKHQPIEPSALLLFMGHRSPSSSSWVVKVKEFIESMKDCLPARCPLIGCTGSGIIGTDRSTCLPREVENSEGLSLMMFPRYDSLQIQDFYVPLRNKYKKIMGIKSFLPNMSLPVKMVIVLAHPISLGKLTHLTSALRSKYGEEVIIVGGYSDSYLFYNNEVAYDEIVGLVLAGDLQSTSVTVTGTTAPQAWENLYDSIERLECSSVAKHRSFNLMFSSFSRGNAVYGYENAECTAFSDRFPRTPVVGFFGTGTFGWDIEQLKSKSQKPGGREFLQTDISVLCLTSVGPVKLQPFQREDLDLVNEDCSSYTNDRTIENSNL